MKVFPEPTTDLPFIYKNTRIYPTYLIFNNQKIEYNDICGVLFESNKDTYNGITMSTTACCIIYFSKTDYTSLLPSDVQEIIIGNIKSTLFLYKEDLERSIFAYKLIEKYTYQNRLNRYLQAIKIQGHFNYLNAATFYNNGDLHTKDGKTVNIYLAIQNGLVGLGEKKRGFKQTSIDPYSLIIYPSKGLKFSILGISLSSRIYIRCSYNFDCIEEIIQRIAIKGKIID